MEHLADDLLNDYLFDQTTLAAQAMAHLTTCPVCQARLDALRLLADELAISRRGTPPPAVRSRAYPLFAQIQQRPSWWARLVQQLSAQLVWDSRQQLAAQGLRNPQPDRYHLLFATDRVEIELSVQPTATHLHLEGELLPIEEASEHDAPLTPMLIHLRAADASMPTYEAQSDAGGHFRFPAIAPGRYTLLLTPPTGALLEIEGLELA
jgi:hypothetical protein